MATYKPSKSPDPVQTNKWIGVNESVGQTGLGLGEAVRQVNFRITKDYKLQKRPGHKTLINFGNVKDVQGVWEGLVGGKDVFIVVNNGKVYEFNKGEL